ncbi:MAG: ChrR family anti-sigma-E factor [Hyphomicrobiales bacterium]
MQAVQPVDSLIAEYVAGNLSLPVKVMVDAHMELVPEARRWAAELENAHGASLETSEPLDLSSAEEMLSSIMDTPAQDFDDVVEPSVQSALMPDDAYVASGNEVPKALHDYIGMTMDDVPWRIRMPGVRSYRLDDVDGCEVSLLRIKPGVAIPSHTHEGRELTFVLQGAFDDGAGHYGRGDIAVADEHVDHQPVACEGEDCICFVVTDAPLRFKSTLARIVSSILPN